MTNKEIYRVWAPLGAKWVDWVRPVPFVEMDRYKKGYSFTNTNIPPAHFIETVEEDTAIIVDLPGAESVLKGLALAKLGFRPIPIYNGTIEQDGARATVDNQSAGVALRWGTSFLAQMDIPKDAPPVFLTDRNRLQRFKMLESLFDNSWDVYPQDLPSAEYLQQNGIRKIIVVGDSIAKDLKKILYPYQKKGLVIYWTKGYEQPQKVKIHKSLDMEKDL